MKINFICIESNRPDWAQMAFKSYASKFNKSININWIGVKPLNRNKNYNVQDIVQRESVLLSSKLKKDDFVITLDKEGQSLSTEKLRFHFDNWISNAKDLSIIVGGPDGLGKELIHQSNFCLSLSKLTFPHAIVPVMALEQIYRVWSITQNHPYHK